MPSHLRKFAQAYNLADWLEGRPAENYFSDVHDLEEILRNRRGTSLDEEDVDDELLTMIGSLLNAETALETMVLSSPAEGHDVFEEGALVPVHEAAAILLLRDYRKSVRAGTWSPDGSGTTSEDEA